MGFPSFQAGNIVRRIHQLQGRVLAFAQHARTLSRMPNFDGSLLPGEASQLLQELMHSDSGPPPATKWGNEFRAAGPTGTSTAPEAFIDVVKVVIEMLNAIIRRYK